MVSLPEALGVLYPGAVPLRDYSVSDYGSGPRIVWWDADLLGPIPTPEALAAVTAADVADARAARVRAEATQLVHARESVPVANRALGIVVNSSFNELRQAVNHLAVLIEQVRQEIGLDPMPVLELRLRTLDEAIQAVVEVIGSGHAG